ncbi:CHAT domain-containing protein [Corallococcus exercitus]|uniref:CHAT domain-containing protein n=1 Tax=Corallococcus exercitus TaxID=2316736 RepID=A0A3A8IED9_9BACT|nr:tetratricopeptide repeat protein [Corallococcus exercitus]NOK36619.1 CHAT domain-containing protein [Corallococcus exercitus]RKG78180.1 CHAT domain-containing protein [Corallococcus exercitus]
MRKLIMLSAIAVFCCASSSAAEPAAQGVQLAHAQKLLDEAVRLRELESYASGISKAQSALKIREMALGSNHLQVADCLQLLGSLFLEQQNLAGAEPLLERALAIREANLDKHHPDIATSLNALADLYTAKNQFSRATQLYERALAIRETVLGKNHPDVASSLDSIASLYLEQGQFAEAEPMYKRALDIREAALGGNHPDVASSLNNLARLYYYQDAHSRAEPLYERALSIRQSVLGENHPKVAVSLNALALIYAEHGLYDKAEILYERSLSILKSSSGKSHPRFPGILSNLARVYMRQGHFSRAERLYKEALLMQEASLGKAHPRVAQALNNLAACYSDQGMYGQAQVIHQRALAILESALGEHHPSVALVLGNLALDYAGRGLFKKAEPLYVRAISIEESVFGKNHYRVAVDLRNLALLYASQGQLARARSILQRSLGIVEAALGEQHPEMAISFKALARFELSSNHPDAAIPILEKMTAISERRLRSEALALSESRLTSLVQLFQSESQYVYHFLGVYPGDSRLLRLALANALLTKGRSVEEVASISRIVYRSLDPKDHDAFERLRGLRTQLSQLSLAGPRSFSPSDYHQRLKELAEQGDALEADLARRSAPLRAMAALPPPEEIVERVAAALPSDGALVEFVVYAPPLIAPPQQQVPPKYRYLALILQPGGQIHSVDLGSMDSIDRAAFDLRESLYRRDESYQRHAQRMYSLVFQPLLPFLGNARRVFLAPDGQLGLIPFDALHDGSRFLIDAFDFTYLTSGKELLPRGRDLPLGRSVVVVADPAVGVSQPTPLALPVDVMSGGQRAPALEHFFSSVRTSSMQRIWAPLPGARREAEFIHKLFPQAQVFLGPEATKQKLLQVAAPGVLHVATHGFFLEDAVTPSDSRSLGHVGTIGGEGPDQGPSDPLLRSGLVLTGARAPPAPNATPADRSQVESFLVTALELAGLDLWGTQLVVLSACDTGRGDVKLGQGIYGLRRALITAGAETVVMSLWKVNDDSTSFLMEDYYRHLLAGEGKTEALRNAVRSLRKTRPHPYYWAPFIASGQDTPLQLLPSGPQFPQLPFSLPYYAIPKTQDGGLLQ